MIGARVIHCGEGYQVIEVLEQSTELVLLKLERVTVIQANQHGDAHRRVPRTVTIPVLTADRTELHPSFLALDLQ
jgi:hypothetical protein